MAVEYSENGSENIVHLIVREFNQRGFLHINEAHYAEFSHSGLKLRQVWSPGTQMSQRIYQLL
jgi:hypothetical protein